MDVEVFSFFSGLGLLDLGFEDAGFNCAHMPCYMMGAPIPAQ